MTREEARRRAVEAAYDKVQRAMTTDYREGDQIEWVFKKPIDLFIAAMADAGWRMVRDCGEKNPATTLYISKDALAQERDVSQVRQRMVADANWAAGKVEGWNACRRAMLGEDE